MEAPKTERERAIRCFVRATKANGLVQKQAWMLAGLRLWHRATGEDVSAHVEAVKNWTRG